MRTPHIARFDEVEAGEEFLSGDGHRYMKVTEDAMRKLDPAGGIVPGHVGRATPDEDAGEYIWEALDIGACIRRDFAPDEKVIRDCAPDPTPEPDEDEACLECGGELELAGPSGPLYCPACDPDLAPTPKPDETRTRGGTTPRTPCKRCGEPTGLHFRVAFRGGTRFPKVAGRNNGYCRPCAEARVEELNARDRRRAKGDPR